MKHIKSLVLLALIISMFSAFISAAALTADKSLSTSAVANYNDVKGSWCEKWVDLYGYAEIFSNSDGSFRPDQAITRMEFARLLHKALGINMNYFAATDISEYYDDVKSGDAGCNELYDLVTCGIIDTKDSFHPTETIKRDEMIHFIMNAFQYLAGNDYAYIEIYHIFEDAKDIKPEYSTDIQHSYILGLVNGRNNNRLFPLETSTRAEAVTITGRLVELKQKLKTSVSVTPSAVEKDGGLVLSLTIKNNSGKAVSINHSSQQLFDFAIFDESGNSLYRWSADRMFAQMVAKTEIAPGKEIVFSDKLDQAAYAAIKSKMKTIKAYIVGTSADFAVDSNGYAAELPALVD